MGLAEWMAAVGLAEEMAAGEGPALSLVLLERSLGSLTRIQPESQGLWLPEMLMQRKGAWRGWGLQSPEKSEPNQ